MKTPEFIMSSEWNEFYYDRAEWPGGLVRSQTSAGLYYPSGGYKWLRRMLNPDHLIQPSAAFSLAISIYQPLMRMLQDIQLLNSGGICMSN